MNNYFISNYDFNERCTLYNLWTVLSLSLLKVMSPTCLLKPEEIGVCGFGLRLIGSGSEPF